MSGLELPAIDARAPEMHLVDAGVSGGSGPQGSGKSLGPRRRLGK
jgi:hypothetical protein